MTGVSPDAAIRVGLIGYGYAGRTFHAPLIRAVPGLDLRLIGSRGPARVAADLPGVAVIADPYAVATAEAVDLVVIATPNDTHAPWRGPRSRPASTSSSTSPSPSISRRPVRSAPRPGAGTGCSGCSTTAAGTATS